MAKKQVAKVSKAKKAVVSEADLVRIKTQLDALDSMLDAVEDVRARAYDYAAEIRLNDDKLLKLADKCTAALSAWTEEVRNMFDESDLKLTDFRDDNRPDDDPASESEDEPYID